MTEIEIETREGIEQADRESLVSFLEGNGFQCYDYENEECLRTAALDHWDTENKTAFKFSELSEKAKEHAIQKHAAPDYEWWDCTYEQYKDDPEIKARGFDIDKINFSGFSSQGDGACWSGRVNLEQYVRHHMTDNADIVKREILLAVLCNGDIAPYLEIVTGNSHYSHSNTMQVRYSVETYYASDTTIAKDASDVFAGAFTDTLMEAIGYEKALEELEQAALDSAREIADKIYSDLEAEYDGYFEEESFSDHADCNDWKFDEDGDLI